MNSISFPNGLTNIGDYAFSNCYSIQSISLPNSLRAIGASAFENCIFSSIELPDGLTIIGPRVFNGNYDLSYVSIPPSLVEIGDNSFDLNNLTLDISDVSAWCKVKINSEIGYGSYKLYLNGKELNDLSIPNDVKTIGSNTFRGCSTITSLTISNSVVEISESAFYDCANLQTVSILSRVDSIAKYTFYKCASLESVIIPDDIELIGEGAFYECEKLKSISLPAKLKSIGNNAFYRCKEIPDIRIPESVTTIGDGAFSGCDGLKSLKISAKLTSIGSGAFSGCNGLTSISVDNGNMVYDSRDNCNAIIETATNTLLIGCNNSTIPKSIQIIGGSAFAGCKELKTIKIPETVKEIGGYAFSGCGLTTIDIPNSVTFIYPGAFMGCKNLTSIILPNSITSILYGTFQSCSSLSSIEIPNSVKSIENWAFASCNSLSSLTIPNSVNYIGSNAFEQCKGLLSINIPNSVTKIGSWAFYACHSLKNVSISHGIEEIGYWFSYCIKLESISIPRSVKKIASRAFEGCHILNEVYCFADEVPEMGSEAIIFPVIDNNTILHVPANSIEKYKKAYIWSKFGNIVALTDEEIAIYNANNSEIAVSTVSNSIEGIYMTQPESYRIYKGNNIPYGNSHEILITDKGNGTYFVDDLFGGWYCQRAGYGPNYSMTGNIEITTNGIVSLRDSYVTGWGDSLAGLTGTYDAERKTFTIEEDYVEGMHFYQTWVKVGDIFTVDGIIYGIGENKTVSVKKGNYSGDIVIPNEVSHNGVTYQVTSIDGAFSGNTSLLSVSLPNSVKSISGAFRGCTALETVNIPNSVTSIERYDFEGCTSLTSIDIPNGVTSIGEWAFVGCTSLTKVNLPNSLISVGEMAFESCFSLTDLTLPENLTTIGNIAFNLCNSLKSVTIPKSVLRIGVSTFAECEDLEIIKVERENIKYDSRGDCNAIIETYTNRLVLGCKNTVIPQDVIIIGRNSFAGCVDLITLATPDNVTTIEGGAFWNCKNLKALTIGSNIKNIESAFTQCPNLKDFYCYSESVPVTKADAFYETPIENATLHVPANSIDEYRRTAPWSGFGKIVALTDNDPKPTSVKSLKADEIVFPVATYSIDGRRISQPQRGLNIIRMSDGSTKKVMIK